jgi:hypothetical protein
MRKIVAVLILLASLFCVTAAEARGGQSADDCVAGSTDPDCVGQNGK